jgi:hypothetical protein
MAQTVSKHRARPLVSEAKIQRDIAIYKRHMMGLSVRAIQDEFAIKSTQTVHLAIQRGREYVIDRGINVEERRIEIDQLFNETLGLLIKTARHQSEKGVEEFFVDQNGNKSMKRRPGVDPRIAGELSRSLNRWAEFCGLLERAPEVNQSTTLIQLATPADGASFTDRWGSGETVDVKASAHESAHVSGLTPAEPAPALDGATVYNAVAPAQGELL